MQNLYQFLVKYVFLLLAISLVITSAGPLLEDTMEDSNQLTDMEGSQLSSGLKNWQMKMLAQKLALAELQNSNQYRFPDYNLQDSAPQNLLLAEYLNYPTGFERHLRSGNSKEGKSGKRGNRCFFNAVSCFGKK